MLGSSLTLATIVAAAAPGAVLAEQPGPVEQAYGVWLAASKAQDEAIEAMWVIEEDLYEAPPLPGFTCWRHFGGRVLESNPERTYARTRIDLSDENIAFLKAEIVKPFDPSTGDPEIAAINHKDRIGRATRTLAEIEAYRAEAKRRADACGLTAAQEREAPLAQATKAARDALLATKPTTFREVAFVAALLRDDWDETAACGLMSTLAEIAGVPDYFDEAAA